VLEAAPNLFGRGLFIHTTPEKSVVINNVLKSFKATSEVDRERATQILDYIIKKKKRIEKRQEEVTKVRNETEYTALLAEIEKEK
jgi:hypothetical protein